MWTHFFIGLVYFAVLVCARRNHIYRDVPSAYLKDCLVEINKYRRLHGSQPLRWAPDLQEHAQLWANHLAEKNTLKNDIVSLNKLRQGQSVSYSPQAKLRCRTYPPKGDCSACRTTIAKWYNESKHYDYKTGYSFDGTKQVLHFTQLVWSDTVKVGIATAVSSLYGLITVARFYPRGNIGFVDDYVSNVAPYGTSMNEEDSFSNTGRRRAFAPPCRPRKRREKVCKNVNGDIPCERYKKNYPGYCKYQKEYMSKYCAKTCGYCKDESLETEEERRQNLKWEIGEWKKCNGDFSERAVKCLHTHNNHVYELKNHECIKEVGAKPQEYKTCF